MNMKRKLSGIVALALTVGTLTVEAQTPQVPQAPAQFFGSNAPVTPVQPFINTLANWVSSYNTSLSWSNGMAIDTGVATTAGSQIADRLELIDNIGSFEVGAAGDFTGVGSAFDSAEAIVGYALVQKYDFKLALELGAGYDFNRTDQHGKKVGAIAIDPEAAIYKLITVNTYATVKCGFPVETVGKFNAVPTIYVGAGFTF